MKKAISLALVMAMALLALCACGLEASDVVGTWKDSYTYDGNQISVVLVLQDDGYYGKITSKNGSVSKVESGEYEIDGRTVILYDSSAATYHGAYTEYKYKGGHLVNGSAELEKVD